jgi:hypothetical protein
VVAAAAEPLVARGLDPWGISDTPISHTLIPSVTL